MDSGKSQTRAVALLGRRDEPTDGVQDYCECLAGELAKHGWVLESVQVPWPREGWLAALKWLWREAKPWNGRRVLLQYTALAWSRRGFPLGLLGVLWILRRRGARCAVIFHDTPYAGNRRIDRLRRNFQLRVMRTAYRVSERSIFTMSLEKIGWLPSVHPKAVFIPVGANIPPFDDLAQRGATLQRPTSGTVVPSLAVFGVDMWPSAQKQEVEAIVHAARAVSARLGEVRLLILGRGALAAEPVLREGLAGSQVALTVLGVLSSREVSVQLAACDALLFVRGAFSTRRGTGLAALACGLPLVAYRGEETAYPLDEGGIIFVLEDDLATLAEEVTRLLADGALRDSLRARNDALYRKWFSWDSIAQRLIASLNGEFDATTSESQKNPQSNFQTKV